MNFSDKIIMYSYNYFYLYSLKLILFQYNYVHLIKNIQHSPKYSKEVAQNLDLTRSITYLTWKGRDQIKAVTSTTPTVYLNTVSYFLFL